MLALLEEADDAADPLGLAPVGDHEGVGGVDDDQVVEADEGDDRGTEGARDGEDFRMFAKAFGPRFRGQGAGSRGQGIGSKGQNGGGAR